MGATLVVDPSLLRAARLLKALQEALSGGSTCYIGSLSRGFKSLGMGRKKELILTTGRQFDGGDSRLYS